MLYLFAGETDWQFHVRSFIKDMVIVKCITLQEAASSMLLRVQGHGCILRQEVYLLGSQAVLSYQRIPADQTAA